MASGSRRRERAVSCEGGESVKRKKCTVDCDAIECPICLEPLTPPVYQCQNGHAACAGCYGKLTTDMCPTCSLPIGGHRNNALEKIIESLRVQCKYAGYGCEKMLRYNSIKRDEHEEECKFYPFQCPVAGCNHEGPKSGLPGHFKNKHNGKSFYYDRPCDEFADDDKYAFTLLTDDVEYDESSSQYVVLHIPEDVEDSEEEASEEEDSEEEDSEEEDFEVRQRDYGLLLLVHHQFHEKLRRYSFSVTSFGKSQLFSEYRLSVDFEREPSVLPSALGRTTTTFKEVHSSEGPIHDNQMDKAFLKKVVRHGDCLFVPKSSASQDNRKFGVLFQVFK